MSLRSFDDADSDEARQFLLDRSCERKHPKRHRTLARSKRISKAKREKAKAAFEAHKKRYSTYLKASQAYWRGDSDGHPVF